MKSVSSMFAFNFYILLKGFEFCFYFYCDLKASQGLFSSASPPIFFNSPFLIQTFFFVPKHLFSFSQFFTRNARQRGRGNGTRLGGMKQVFLIGFQDKKRFQDERLSGNRWVLWLQFWNKRNIGTFWDIDDLLLSFVTHLRIFIRRIINIWHKGFSSCSFFCRVLFLFSREYSEFS